MRLDLCNVKPEAKKLSKPVKDYMRRRFFLLPEYLDLLKCFDYDSVIDHKQVRCVRIFSPRMAAEHDLAIMTNVELGQHPEMLLYEGYVDSQGGVYIAACRAPMRSAKTN